MWDDLNIFVMKLIRSFENKNYKSIGYQTAYELGKGLVVPFRFVEDNFNVYIEGYKYIFS